ncbi:hypothetical protein CRYUN_Cryun07bG0115300 [Craigia yunnanensis]
MSSTLLEIEIYEDKDNARKDEIAALGGQTASGINIRIENIPRLVLLMLMKTMKLYLKEESVMEFSGEVSLSLSLSHMHIIDTFCYTSMLFYIMFFFLASSLVSNSFSGSLGLVPGPAHSKFGAKTEYSAYLDVFSQPHNIPLKLKSTRQYREYMENLLQYLIHFFQRTEPLQDLDRIFSKVEAKFEEQWADGQVQGWDKQGQENGDDPSQHTVIDLDYYSTFEELMEVGPEKLKEHTPLEKLDKKHFAKGSCGPKENGSTAILQDINSLKDVALMEAKMKNLCDLLSKEETQVDTESDEEDQQIYNPLKLPMGWDGKPIPYWLYKLHGLGQILCTDFVLSASSVYMWFFHDRASVPLVSQLVA